LLPLFHPPVARLLRAGCWENGNKGE